MNYISNVCSLASFTPSRQELTATFYQDIDFITDFKEYINQVKTVLSIYVKYIK